MDEPIIYITDECVIENGVCIPIEEYNFEECPTVAELLGILFDNERAD